MKNYLYIAFVVLYSCSSSIPDEYVQKIDRLTAELKKTKAIASLAVSKVNELEEKLTISIEERDSIIYDHKQETELLRASDSFHKGNNALFTKQYKKAIEHYLKTVQYRPNDAHAYNNLGSLYLDQAIPLIDKMNNLGLSQADQKKYNSLKSQRNKLYKDAQPYLEEAVRINNTEVQLLNALKDVCYQTDDIDCWKKTNDLLKQISK